MNFDNPTILNKNQDKSYRKPHDYQQEAIEKLENSLIIQDKKAGILQIPTGGGKTYTTVYWLLNSLIHKEYKIVWIAHRIDLLEQAMETMIEESYLLKGLSRNPKAIIVGGGYNPGSVIATAKENILLLSFQTIAKNRGEKALMSYCKKNKKNKVIFVIDEAHHSVASSYKVFIKRDIQPISNFKLLGLTATPTRTVESEKAVLWNLFDNNRIFEIGINKLIKTNKLANPIPVKIQTNINLEEAYEITEKTRKHYETFHELDESFLNDIGKHSARNKIIVDTYINDKEKYGKTLVFAINKIHCITLFEEFKKQKNIKVDYTYSGKEGHSDVIQKFKNNKLDVLINISKLTEGFDEPKIQTVFLTRPTQSEILFSQMIGRGLRGGANGTKDAYLVSFEDHWNKFTGWLDSDKYLQISGIEDDEEHTKTRDKVEQRDIPILVIQELYRQIKQLPISNNEILPFEYTPIGWYTINTITEDSIPTRRTILVFQHQKKSWEELCKVINKKKPNNKELKSLYNFWFEDLPSPIVSFEIVKMFVDSCYNTNNYIEPKFFAIEDREKASPNILAKEIYEKSVGGKKRYEIIHEWYNKYNLLQDLYNDIESFTEIVDKAERDIASNKKPIGINIDKPFLEDKIKLIIPETDNKYLNKIFNNLKKDKSLFPNGYNYKPTVEWTNRIMKSYFGIAYIDESRNKIKINRLLFGEQLEQREELIRFVMYHEMLHFSVSRFHNLEFRQREEIYPNIVELNSLLDRINIDYKMELFN